MEECKNGQCGSLFENDGRMKFGGKMSFAGLLPIFVIRVRIQVQGVVAL